MHVSQAVPVSDSSTGFAPVFAAAFGIAILFAVGFAQPQLLHDAAHDTRHAISFPCH
jgi:cobalt transporter subunit CbtB